MLFISAKNNFSCHFICMELFRKKTKQTSSLTKQTSSLKWAPGQSLPQNSTFVSCGSTDHLSYRDRIWFLAVLCKLWHIDIKLLLLLYYFSCLLSFLADLLKRQSAAKKLWSLHKQCHPSHCCPLTCQYTRFYKSQSWSTGSEYKIFPKTSRTVLYFAEPANEATKFLILCFWATQVMFLLSQQTEIRTSYDVF